MAKRVPYGGQAVIEGVMIRGKSNIAIAVRRPDNEIQLKTDPIQSLFTGTLKKVPLVRGFITLLEVMVIGTRALMYSAQVAIDELEGGEGEERGTGTDVMLWVTLAVGLAFGIAVFFVGPVFLNEWLDDRISSAALLNVIEGGVRLGLFLGYILLIGRMKDIQRVFAYHGAEHMSIHAMEHDEELSVDNVRKYTTLHPRCGTAFLIAGGADRDSCVPGPGASAVVDKDRVPDSAFAGNRGYLLRGLEDSRSIFGEQDFEGASRAGVAFTDADDSAPGRQPDRGGDCWLKGAVAADEGGRFLPALLLRTRGLVRHHSRARVL